MPPMMQKTSIAHFVIFSCLEVYSLGLKHFSSQQLPGQHMAQHFVHTRKNTTKKHTMNNKEAMAIPGMAGVTSVSRYCALKSLADKYAGSEPEASFRGNPVKVS